MPSASNKRKTKIVESIVAARRNLKTEINWAEKKMKKLLSRYEAGLKRWTLKGNQKVESKKLQGFASNSARHKKLLGHINRMKTQLKELGK